MSSLDPITGAQQDAVKVIARATLTAHHKPKTFKNLVKAVDEAIELIVPKAGTLSRDRLHENTCRHLFAENALETDARVTVKPDPHGSKVEWVVPSTIRELADKL